SAANRCHYCIVSHSAALRKLTGDAILVEQLQTNHAYAKVEPKERAMLDFTVKLTEQSHRCTEADVEALREVGWTDEDIMDIADAVPDVGVLGDDPERHLLADARNEHGDLARGRRVELREALLDHGQRGVESAQAAADGAELVAVLVEVALEPAGADAEKVPAAGDVVDRPRHVGEQVRIPV